MGLLIAVVFALLVWYLSRKHKRKSSDVGRITVPARKTRVRVRVRKRK